MTNVIVCWQYAIRAVRFAKTSNLAIMSHRPRHLECGRRVGVRLLGSVKAIATRGSSSGPI